MFPVEHSAPPRQFLATVVREFRSESKKLPLPQSPAVCALEKSPKGNGCLTLCVFLSFERKDAEDILPTLIAELDEEHLVALRAAHDSGVLRERDDTLLRGTFRAEVKGHALLFGGVTEEITPDLLFYPLVFGDGTAEKTASPRGDNEGNPQDMVH